MRRWTSRLLVGLCGSIVAAALAVILDTGLGGSTAAWGYVQPDVARFTLLSTFGIFRILGVSFGGSTESLAPSVQQFARATKFRASGYQAAADEIRHIRESASEVRSSRRTLEIPVVVVTGGRGSQDPPSEPHHYVTLSCFLWSVVLASSNARGGVPSAKMYIVVIESSLQGFDSIDVSPADPFDRCGYRLVE